jgi:hypothetical protein
MELDLKVLKNKANEAVVISHASIVIPFALHKKAVAELALTVIAIIDQTLFGTNKLEFQL